VDKDVALDTGIQVILFFEKLAGEAGFVETRKLKDEQGLYLWEIKIAQEDGGTTEYSYIRKGDYKKRGLDGDSASETAIHAVYFDNGGVPISGQSVLKLINDKWIETP